MPTLADGDSLRGILASTVNATDPSDYALAHSLTRAELDYYKSAADGAAATATANLTFGVARRQQRLFAAYWMPEAALTADPTNYATIVVSRRPAAGGTDIVMASISTTLTATGGSGSWTAGVAVPLTLSTVAGATIQEALGSWRFGITKTGSGVVVPIGTLLIVPETF